MNWILLGRVQKQAWLHKKFCVMRGVGVWLLTVYCKWENKQGSDRVKGLTKGDWRLQVLLFPAMKPEDHKPSTSSTAEVQTKAPVLLCPSDRTLCSKFWKPLLLARILSLSYCDIQMSQNAVWWPAGVLVCRCGVCSTGCCVLDGAAASGSAVRWSIVVRAQIEPTSA